MTTLVTGGLGYIGSHVVHALRDAGEPVVVVDNRQAPACAELPKDVPVIETDIDFWLLSPRCRDVDTIIHLAARIDANASVVQPARYYRDNVSKSLRLIDKAVAHGVKNFIFASSAAVYGDQLDAAVLSEVSRTYPVSPYGWSKLMTEIQLRDICVQAGINHCSLRFFNVVGADPQGRTGPRPAGKHLFARVLQALKTREPLPIFGVDFPTQDGTAVRDYVHVSDVAQAVVAVLKGKREGDYCDLFNVGYGRGYTVRQVIEAAEVVYDRTVPVIELPRRKGDPAKSIAVSHRLVAHTSWKPRYDSLTMMLDHLKSWEEKGATNG